MSFWYNLQYARELHKRLIKNGREYIYARSRDLDQLHLQSIACMLLDYFNPPDAICLLAPKVGTRSAEVDRLFAYLDEQVSEPSAAQKALDAANPMASTCGLRASFEEEQADYAAKSPIRHAWEGLPHAYEDDFRRIWDLLECKVASLKQVRAMFPEQGPHFTTTSRRLKAMMKTKLIQHDRKMGGYFRPDAPPQSHP